MSEVETVAAPPCKPGRAHHWVLGPQEGPRATGVCKHCRAERDFETGEVLKRWTMPPTDPAKLPDRLLKPAGRDSAPKHGKLTGIRKAETRLKLQTEVDHS